MFVTPNTVIVHLYTDYAQFLYRVWTHHEERRQFCVHDMFRIPAEKSQWLEALGPAVYSLNNWGDDRKTSRRHKNRVSSLNHYFLTLIKLRLNLHRFGVSVGLVSKFFVTWVCFLYQQHNEIRLDSFEGTSVR